MNCIFKNNSFILRLEFLYHWLNLIWTHVLFNVVNENIHFILVFIDFNLVFLFFLIDGGFMNILLFFGDFGLFFTVRFTCWNRINLTLQNVDEVTLEQGSIDGSLEISGAQLVFDNLFILHDSFCLLQFADLVQKFMGTISILTYIYEGFFNLLSLKFFNDSFSLPTCGEIALIRILWLTFA